MSVRKKKSPFLLDQPSGSIPKRDQDHNLLLNLHKKLKDNIDKLKKGR
ncbi:hypothetical protein J7E81_12465 [Bacillus sp. ISL-18]|nr:MULTISPECIES: hypothetical protein [Bacillaceae]MBT2656034.1 hypothetical protein [Bacillus sp. ISL-18]ULT54480.1 hypothetical protein L1999_15010 [Neobacillus drentensis]